MKAAVLHGKEDVRVEDIALPALKPGEVRIRIEAALTCGTDLKVFKRGYHAKMIVPPAVFGHELSGTICEVASDVGDWQIGERVVVANSAPCGDCLYCKEGQENLCDHLLFLNGAYAETIAVPARIVQKNLLRLKPETSFRDAALVEPLACVVQGIDDTRLRVDQNILIIGSGPIGLMFVALAKHIGCNIIVVGRGEKRLEAACRLGAKEAIDVDDKDTLHARMSRRFDAVIEAVGKPETWQRSVELVRKGGTVNFFGGCPSGTSVTLDTTLIHYSNLTLLASFHHTPRTIRKALEFIEAGVIRAADFVDGECPLSQLPELFKSMAAGNRVVKTLIDVKR
ncbi:MAG TPA: zinc-binding dehydrogenase [Verrucomicrobiae bacterium]|jgi:L-iditol 2-dehydrogenase|nr:zinc-binding dehydrogenase [Verrucomicrobiae bacterium]